MKFLAAALCVSLLGSVLAPLLTAANSQTFALESASQTVKEGAALATAPTIQ